MRETLGTRPIVPAIKAFSAVIVDDEADACDNLQYMLQEVTSNTLQIAGVARNVNDATRIINKLKPDVVFLDIDLANDHAFALLERLKPISFEIVFVTAYDEYAIKAFKLNAVDYIVKPIDSNDLKYAIDKLQERLSYKKIIHQQNEPYKNIAEDINEKSTTQRITLRDNNNVEVVHFKDVMLIEAQRSYSKVMFQKNGLQKAITMSYSIAEYEELLPMTFFFRVHKSYLINCYHINKITREEQSYVTIGNQFQIPISRRKFTEFIAFLKSNHINE